jgi:hypothetical protein
MRKWHVKYIKIKKKRLYTEASFVGTKLVDLLEKHLTKNGDKSQIITFLTQQFSPQSLSESLWPANALPTLEKWL